MSTIFNTNVINHLEEPMFLGSSQGIARYDTQRLAVFEELIEKQLSFFWRPQEINLMMDRGQFDKLPEYQKQIFLNNLKYQTLLDSIQGRAPAAALAPICSDPVLDTWLQTWTFSETIHSRSYTHIIRSLLDDPSAEFDTIILNEAIMKRAESICVYYDDVIKKTRVWQTSEDEAKKLEDEGKVESFALLGLYNRIDKERLELMESLYLCMHVINALEAIRFYVSFACTFNFAKNMEIMEGNAKIMKLIARDEQLHLKGTQFTLRQWQSGKDGEVWAEIAKRLEPKAVQIFLDVAEQEKEWVDYLFKDGVLPGLNHKILKDYVDYLTASRMNQCGLPYNGESPKRHPIAWIREFLNSDSVQSAPQEVEISSYLVAQIDNDIDDKVITSFKKYL
ncbi:hypothetical protein fHeYen901_249 [Yersinia phage fHe-Yen9-01]|uniref:ribonucleoside-diphosphate reductase n=1 Tax=Yersinia phage fHe-Yen9-01 TaxID=1965363 RepID=A0A1V0DXZ0_9CAUD|nr:ribonucleoside diphosphate reductase small subunit [Yersinia phage fHe-Yen9-01]ARB06022.1 hypothetical protein fHeYen901_249 [Yersinia phage fHe-Yen9-01]